MNSNSVQQPQYSLATQVGGHAGVMSDSSGSLIIKVSKLSGQTFLGYSQTLPSSALQPALPREIAFYQLLSSAPIPHNTTISSSNSASTEAELSRRYAGFSQRQLLGELKRYLPRFYGTLRLEGQLQPSSAGKDGSSQTPEVSVWQPIPHRAQPWTVAS